MTNWYQSQCEAAMEEATRRNALEESVRKAEAQLQQFRCMAMANQESSTNWGAIKANLGANSANLVANGANLGVSLVNFGYPPPNSPVSSSKFPPLMSNHYGGPPPTSTNYGGQQTNDMSANSFLRSQTESYYQDSLYRDSNFGVYQQSNSNFGFSNSRTVLVKSNFKELSLQDSYKSMEETNCNMIDTIEQLRESFREIADELRQWREEIEAKALTEESANSQIVENSEEQHLLQTSRIGIVPESQGCQEDIEASVEDTKAPSPAKLQFQFEMPKVIHHSLNALVFEEELKRMAVSVEVEDSIDTGMVDFVWNAYKVFDEMPNGVIIVMGRGSWNFDPGGLDSGNFRSKDVVGVMEIEKVISSCVTLAPIVFHKALAVNEVFGNQVAHKVLVEMLNRQDHLITRLVEEKKSEIAIDDWSQYMVVFDYGIGEFCVDESKVKTGYHGAGKDIMELPFDKEKEILFSLFFSFWRISAYPY